MKKGYIFTIALLVGCLFFGVAYAWNGPHLTPPGGNPSAEEAWPVGSTFLSVVPTDPAVLLGYGTWVQIAQGRALVGQNPSDPDWDTAEETRGSKTHTLTVNEMPSHTHTQNAHNHGVSDPGHSHNIAFYSDGHNAPLGGNRSIVTDYRDSTGYHPTASKMWGNSSTTGISIGDTTATNQNTGGGAAHNNIQPSFVIYVWKRTL
jgi:microcystin-dependent protein